MAIGVNWRGEDDGPYETPEQVDELLDMLRARTIESGDAITAMVYRPGDDEFEGPMLEIGVNHDKGYVMWNDPPSGEGEISYGGSVSQTRSGLADNGTEAQVPSSFVYYHFQGQQAEQDASHEVPYETVKQAVKEFLATNGGKPSNVPWKPEQ